LLHGDLQTGAAGIPGEKEYLPQKKSRIIPHRDNSGRSKIARSRSVKKLHCFIQTKQAYFSLRVKTDQTMISC
jgi:hypothetical protein